MLQSGWDDDRIFIKREVLEIVMKSSIGCAGRERVISKRISRVECTVNGKYAHPVSTGFSRIILAAGVCCSTGMVSLIGLGETALEAGVRPPAPGVNKERMKRKVKQNVGES